MPSGATSAAAADSPTCPAFTVRSPACARLAPGVSASRTGLVDALGEHVQLNPSGALVASLLGEWIEVDGLARELAMRMDLPAQLVRVSLDEFLTDLNRRQLVGLNRSFLAEFGARLALVPIHALEMMTIRVLPVRAFASRRRYPPTVLGVIRACVEAYQPTTWIALGGVVAAYLISLLAMPTVASALFVGSAIAAIIGFTSLVLVASAIAHELAHLLVARATRSRPTGSYAGSGVAGVTFSERASVATAATAAAGPLAGIAFLLLVAAAIVLPYLGAPSRLFDDRLPLAQLLGVLALVVYQAWGFTPATGDGRRLWSAVRRRAQGPGSHA